MIRTFIIVITATVLFYGDPTCAYSSGQDAFYADAAKLARSTDESDLANLEAWLTDTTFLAKLDSSEAYNGQAVRLRVAGVMQILAENSAPPARELLLALTTSSAFLEHRARVEVLILSLVQIRPAPKEAVEFWGKHFQPEDGYTPVTVGALLENRSEPAIALFERKMLDTRFPETEREYWLTVEVLQHRNDLPLLQACDRLLESNLEELYRLLLVDVLFDYKPDDWYGAGYWYKPPPRENASTEALEQLRTLGQKALENHPLSKHQKNKIKVLINNIDLLIISRTKTQKPIRAKGQ